MNQLRPIANPKPKSAASGRKIPVRRRFDLKIVRTRHKHDSAVVVKDPIAMKYHRLRPDEYFVLERLDGKTTLEKLREAYESRYAPQKVTTAELNELLFRFHRSGLTISDIVLQGDRLRERAQKERFQRWVGHLSGVLFIRFPGVDPEPLLRRIYPLARPFLGRLGMIAAMSVCLFAALLLATRIDTFISQFPEMGQWIQLRAVLILAAVIGSTKVLHELGHAVVCKHFGGECHQIGPMLLVFTPALYCDTSDSWMLESRMQRAAVGLAGIATEVMVAALATIVWASTGAGIVHYVAMNVMLICSVSTVMFNANPLLRYDGYFVLSDIIDVPNLAEKSRRLLAGHFNQVAFGVDELSDELMSRTERFWLLVYGIAAFCYRWLLSLTILWLVANLLRPYGLESLGTMLCVFAIGGMLFSLLRNPFKFFRSPARRKLMRMNRLIASSLTTAVLIGVALYPIPSGVSVAARMVPHQETPIYVTTSGVLRSWSAHPGDWITKGDVIARLENPEVELQYLTIQGRYETQRAVVQSMQRASLDDADVANELPGQEAVLEDLTHQLATQTSRREGLTLQSPASGKLIDAPRRAEDVRGINSGRLVSWSGYPTDPKNENCFLESGYELMSVVGDDSWDAEIVLDQSEVERIRVGAQVKLALETLPSKKFAGTVSDISRTQWDEQFNAQRRDDPDASHQKGPLTTSYMVRVKLDPTDDVTLITGAVATARIEASKISLVNRTWRWLSGLLRFR